MGALVARRTRFSWPSCTAPAHAPAMPPCSWSTRRALSASPPRLSTFRKLRRYGMRRATSRTRKPHWSRPWQLFAARCRRALRRRRARPTTALWRRRAATPDGLHLSQRQRGGSGSGPTLYATSGAARRSAPYCWLRLLVTASGRNRGYQKMTLLLCSALRTMPMVMTMPAILRPIRFQICTGWWRACRMRS